MKKLRKVLIQPWINLWEQYEYGRVGLSAARRHRWTKRVDGHVAGKWLRARRECWAKFEVQQ